MTEENLDPYYYVREHDGSGWSVRGPNGFVMKAPVDHPLDKNVAYVIAKLLSDKRDEALQMIRVYEQIRKRLQELSDRPQLRAPK